MNFATPAHIACYLSVIAVFFCGLFCSNEVLVFIKPVSTLTLIWIYFENRAKVSALFPIIMIVIMINDVFVLSDFDRFFRYVGILLPLYYILCSYLLKPYFSLKGLRYLDIFNLPTLIGILLVVYVTISVFNLVMPSLEDSMGFAVLIIITLFIYLGVCFIVYLRNQFSHTNYLLLAAICCILVNALVPVQELYYDNPLFKAVIYSVDIVAMFFYLKFLICTEPEGEDKMFSDYL